MLKEAQQNGGAVLGSELVDCLVEDGRNQHQVRRGMVLAGVHFDSVPFPGLAAAFAPHGFGGDKAGVAMQPPTQHHVAGKRARLARQIHEDNLGNVLRQVRVAADQPNRG